MQTSKSIAAEFGQLSQCSNKELCSRLKEISRVEKQCQAKLIACICEVQSRRLHLDLGYKSLFEFCMVELGL